MKTYSAKPADVERKWYIMDASEAPIGRLSTRIAGLLMGKGKPQFTHHIDCGDFVVVINSAKLVATGDKLNKKVYYRHSNYPGGLKERTLSEQLEKDANVVIFNAVRGMLPVNKLRDERLKRLKIYTDSEHKHDPQKPVSISVKDIK
jgi:large subunit ribosomal protein L13